MLKPMPQLSKLQAILAEIPGNSSEKPAPPAESGQKLVRNEATEVVDRDAP